MRRRVLTGLVVSVLIIAGLIMFWPSGKRSPVGRSETSAPGAGASARGPQVANSNQYVISAATAPAFLTGVKSATGDLTPANPLAYRLANTSKPVGQLLRDDRAILLENALIDTTKPVDFQIPARLRGEGDPGSYLVQSRGPADAAFRAALTDAGAEMVSYIPNNAWLVRASADAADRLAANAQIQTVLPWEPVYKLKAELLQLAMEEKPLAADAKLNLLVFGGAQGTVAAQLQQMNVTVLHEDRSPFGTVLTVEPPEEWVALARLSGVQLLEQAYRRAPANDRTRVRLGVAEDTQTQTNYLGLTGTNVLVNMNDSGVDDTHPDLAGRVFAEFPVALNDTNGHGTHVAGIIMGSGAMSTNVLNARGSVNPATTNQYRGIASGARLFVQPLGFGTNITDDADLQEGGARTNAFISNNSWIYLGASSYSLASASYDAAVRDSLPGVPGSQPVFYVFPAGNAGEGSDDGKGGFAGSVRAPGTAKNVMTVGALELERDITNVVEKIIMTSTNTAVTNATQYWKNMTSSENQVAGFSSRGNVGIGIEGDFGRFKPDVVAPGTFVISTRSTEWDEIAYYNPTNHKFAVSSESADTNALKRFNLFLPENTVGFRIYLIPNADSPTPFPNLRIYVGRDTPPTTVQYDLLRTNFVAVPPDLGGVGTAVGQNWYYAILNRTASRVFFDIITEIITTNDLGNYHTVLSNLNNSISSTNAEPGVPPNYYRYESGTSMAAPAVAGTAALMQEFFEQRLRVTNSPALMKALLINGARSASQDYDFQVRNAINYQGWGLVRLENSLQPGISNAFNNTVASPATSMLVYDQAPTNALATGQKRTWNIGLDEEGQILPLRVTLTWTDPPGNPAAGVKLVNDLDLIITNKATGEVYLGNDFNNGTPFTAIWDTNAAPNFDAVNNVENIYLEAPLDTNYSITVVARRVNVNAVTAHANDVVQDFALVISSGSGEGLAALRVTEETGILTNPRADVIHMTNSINTATFSSSSLVNQRVGANTPLLGTTNGLLSQWKFYVLTNGTTFTNAAFLISQQTDLAIPRQGVNSSILLEATRRYADLDLYVSTNPALTNLDAAVLAASVQSRTRNELSGDEYVTFTNSSAGATYYVGVKSEDQQAAQFEFWGIFSLLPLGEEENGYVRAYPMLGFDIPDGGNANPGGTRFVAITRSTLTGSPESVRRVLVTNNIAHARYADLINTMDHNSRVVVLDNHRELLSPPYPIPPGPYALLYDDSGEGDHPTAVAPDGPGNFEGFIGEAPGGTWYFTYSDDNQSQTGRVNDVRLRIERQREDNGESTNTVAGNSWIYFSRNVPVEATNLTICVDIISGTPGPLQLYVRKGTRPSPNAYDYSLVINPPGDCLTIDKSLLPPLSAGRYFIGIFNPNPTAQTFVYSARLGLGLPPTPLPFSSGGGAPLLDDAVTNYSIFITNEMPVATVDVGLRIDHPRVSDLAVTLISPRGTRVLLAENRGGTDPNGFGSSLTVTNFLPLAADGGPAATNIFVDTGATAGSVTIDYQFFAAPDQMTVYYEGNLLPGADTGMIDGAGRLTLPYGPGNSTLLEIRMNEFGNTNVTTRWELTVSSYNTAHSYLTFTDNTNLTTTPIKFAAPPFVGLAGANYLVSDFEPPVVAQNYVGPTVGTPDGWSVLATNPVTVITNTAYSGVNALALRSGTIQRTLPTIPGQTYRLGYAYRKRPSLDGLVAWWQGENNTVDIINGNVGTIQGGMGYGVGQVGQAFNVTDNNDGVFVPASPSLLTTNLTIETWIFPTDSSGHRVIVEFANPTGLTTVSFIHNWNGGYSPGALCTVFRTPTGNLLVSSGANAVPLNQWSHVAVTYDYATRTARLYRNGVEIALATSPVFITPQTTVPFYIGYRSATSGELLAGNRFAGQLDEVSIFNRALGAGELQDIYSAGAAGKCGMGTPPTVCGSPLGAQISVLGQVTNTFLGTDSWQLGGLVFTAANSNTVINLAPVNTNLPSGVLVDYFTLAETTGPRYVLPEESLKVLEGEKAFGLWQLEVLDTRTGASNNISLVDWQLSFVFQTNTALPRVLIPGVPVVTTNLPPGQIIYFIVDVPTFARFATNVLFNANVPVSFYFNQIRPPSLGATNLAGGDVVFAANVQNHTEVLSTAPTVPPLLPGQRYFLAVENTSAANAAFTVYVDFDLATFPVTVDLTNGVPYCTANPVPLSLDYYRFTVASNSVRAQFDLRNLSGDMTLFLRRDLPPTLAVFDYLSANVFTNDEVITVFDFSQPVPLAPGDWYAAAANLSTGPVTYCMTARQWASYGTNIVITNVFLGTNSFCLTWTSLEGIPYVVEGVTNLTSTNWVVVSPTVIGTANTTTYCVPLPSPYQFFRVREGQALSTYVPPPSITRIRQRFNGIEITWSGPPGQQYQVEWSPTLIPTVWTPFTEIITSVTGIYQYLDDGSQTAGFGPVRYYRLVLLP
jgi:subtilisin family serine protease/subtilisin-like proprotein convertase family protein